jgi:predicted phage gp36 major capsid-like protein
MSGGGLREIDERLKLLELEASVQRVTLAATFVTWSERRSLVWGAAAAKIGVRLLTMPQLRWLIFGRVLAKLRRGRGR